MAADNMSLGRFRLEGLPMAPRGMPQVEVIFDIDANGIIHVTAKDKATGKEQKVAITASTNLNQGEIDRMVQQAKEHAGEDTRRKELVEARNTADTLAYQTEKTLRELGDKVPAAERQNIEGKLEGLREAAKGDDAARIKRLSDELQNAFHALSQQLYASQAAQDGGSTYPGGNGHGPEEGEVIEGEFREA